MGLIVSIILLVVGLWLVRRSDQNTKISKLQTELTNSRLLVDKMTREINGLKRDIQREAKFFEHESGWTAENVIILTTPEEVYRFSSSLDGSQLNAMNLKISIYRDKMKMLEELHRLLKYAEPCFKN